MEQILLAFGLHEESIKDIMMLNKKTKIKVQSLDGKTDFFDIVAGGPKGDALAPYLFVIYLDYKLQTSINLMKNSFTLKKQTIPYMT